MPTSHPVIRNADPTLPERSLASILRDHGPLPVIGAVDITLDICDELANAHANGVVHGDLGVHRVRTTWPRVASQGVSIYALADVDTAAFQIKAAHLVTLIAPEQREKKIVDHRVDVWAVGAMLYWMIVGSPPMQSTPSVIAQALGSAPQTIVTVVQACLADDPQHRPSSVNEIAEALASFSSSPPARFEQIVRRRTMLETPPTRRLNDEELDRVLGALDEAALARETSAAHAAAKSKEDEQQHILTLERSLSQVGPLPQRRPTRSSPAIRKSASLRAVPTITASGSRGAKRPSVPNTLAAAPLPFTARSRSPSIPEQQIPTVVASPAVPPKEHGGPLTVRAYGGYPLPAPPETVPILTDDVASEGDDRSTHRNPNIATTTDTTETAAQTTRGHGSPDRDTPDEREDDDDARLTPVRHQDAPTMRVMDVVDDDATATPLQPKHDDIPTVLAGPLAVLPPKVGSAPRLDLSEIDVRDERFVTVPSPERRAFPVVPNAPAAATLLAAVARPQPPPLPLLPPVLEPAPRPSPAAAPPEPGPAPMRPTMVSPKRAEPRIPPHAISYDYPAPPAPRSPDYEMSGREPWGIGPVPVAAGPPVALFTTPPPMALATAMPGQHAFGSSSPAPWPAILGFLGVVAVVAFVVGAGLKLTSAAHAEAAPAAPATTNAPAPKATPTPVPTPAATQPAASKPADTLATPAASASVAPKTLAVKPPPSGKTSAKSAQPAPTTSARPPAPTPPTPNANNNASNMDDKGTIPQTREVDPQRFKLSSSFVNDVLR